MIKIRKLLSALIALAALAKPSQSGTGDENPGMFDPNQPIPAGAKNIALRQLGYNFGKSG
ncbi:MAG: hypothetical protein HY846_10080 [Nitrosomonadales bacterium]|nr:hypothetical protein [Nitrosomonadales bacterium]